MTATETRPVPAEDHLDLRTLETREIPEALADYLRACRLAGIFTVRIVHGEDGVLRETVWQCLMKDALVAFFGQAPPEKGGQNATVVKLKKPV